MAFSGKRGRWLAGGGGRVKGGEGEGGKSSLEAPTCMLWFLRPEIHFGFWTIPRPTLLKNLFLFFLILLTSSSLPSFPHPPNPSPGPRRGLRSDRALTRVWLVAVVTLSEVLRVLDDRNAGHADHHRVRASVQGWGRRDAVVDVMEGTGWILLSADHCHRTCKHHVHPSGTRGKKEPSRAADQVGMDSCSGSPPASAWDACLGTPGSWPVPRQLTQQGRLSWFWGTRLTVLQGLK